jgi:hypothetical protein
MDDFSKYFHEVGILLPLSLFMVEFFIFNGSILSYGQSFRSYCALRLSQALPIVNCDDPKSPQGTHNQGVTMFLYVKEIPYDNHNSIFEK